MFLAFSPCAFRRACVAVRKSRVIDSWQVSQLSEPTNSAPGMLGGARMARFVSSVLHESRTTASAAAPLIAQNNLSRLRWIHRVSLECHTDGEYCQRHRPVTTHFFGKSDGSFCGAIFDLAPFSLLMSCAIRTRRFIRQPFEDTIELRERLEPHSECDFADAQIRIQQQIARFVESGACHVIDKIYAGDLLELLAEMIRADVDCSRYFVERKFFAGMFVDELPRFPDFHRFGTIPVLARDQC